MISFPDAIKSFFSNFFKLSGRATRAEFWWSFLFTAIWVIVVGSISYTIIAISPPPKQGNIDGFLVGLVLAIGFALLANLVVVVPFYTVTIRRMHDRGHSGWWVFASYFMISGVVIFFSAVVLLGFLVLFATLSSGDTGGVSAGSAPIVDPNSNTYQQGQALGDSLKYIFWAIGALGLAVTIFVIINMFLSSKPVSNKYGDPKGYIELTSSTVIAAYRPVMPAPVFEKNVDAPLDNGRFSANRQQQMEIAPAPSAPKFYKRSGLDTDLPIPSVGLPEIPKLFKPTFAQNEETESLEERTEVGEIEEVEEMPQFSYASKPEEQVRPPVEEDLPAIELLDMSSYSEEETPKETNVPKLAEVPKNSSLPKLPDFKPIEKNSETGKTPPPPPTFGNK